MAHAGRAVGVCVAASGCAFAVYKLSQYSPGESTFSRQEVAAHNIRQDCWIVIDNDVYDVTQWLDKHPGTTVFAFAHLGVNK